MYRPQFAYSTPPGCRDEEFTYFFDGANTPSLATNISGRRIENIPLPLEQDAPFYWRGFKVALLLTTGANGGAGTVTAWDYPDIGVKFRDPYQNDLSDGFIPATQYGFAQNPLSFNNSFLTGSPVPLVAEIYCPPGSYVLFFIDSPARNDALVTVSLYGVKRFKECGV